MTIFAEEIQNIRTMIRIYGMHTCPDCACIEGQVRNNDGYEIIDIGEHVRNLKAFLRLRDSSPVFDEARRNGSIGIPCFVLEHPLPRRGRSAPAYPRSSGKCEAKPRDGRCRKHSSRRGIVQPGRERLLKQWRNRDQHRLQQKHTKQNSVPFPPKAL